MNNLMRFGHKGGFFLLGATWALGCGIGGVSRSGPTPELTAVVRGDSSFAPDAVYCSSKGGTLLVQGKGFAPLVTDILTDSPAVELPSVTLIGPDGEVVLADVTYDAGAGTLTATVPTGLSAGSYDVRVTNPDGKSATLAGAVQITATCLTIDLCSTVDPAFGWVSARTTIEICASNAAGSGLIPTPEVFIQISGVDVPLIRESFLSLGTATTPSLISAVVPSQADDARLVVGGPYAIHVVNPNGADGTITDAFRVLIDAPPAISTVNPALGDTSNAALGVTITGANFKAASVVTVALVAESGSEIPCSGVVVTGGTQIQCTLNLSTAPTGGYVVRVRHEDDGAFALFSAFAVTQPSRKLGQTPSAQPSLNQARRAHGVVLGSDDLGNRFLYALGGEFNDATAGYTALAGGEVASVSKFGQAGDWQRLPHSFPEGRSGVAVAVADRYVYALGGTIDGSTALSANQVLRAKILGSETAPILADASVGTSGSLAAGTYYYRVSAMSVAGTDNPLGETLASDEVPARVGDNGSVGLSWSVAVPADVDRYRIYRSADPDALSGSEVLLFETASNTPTTFTDDGSLTPAPAIADVPLPVGSLGVWVPVASTGATFVDRFDAAATVVRLDTTHVSLYVAGGRAGGVLTSTQWAALDSDGGSAAGLNWQNGPAVTARAEHALLPLYSGVAASVPSGTFALVAVGGSNGSRLQANKLVTSIETSTLSTTAGSEGAPAAWAASTNGIGSSGVEGFTAVITNDYLYEFNGWAGVGGSFPTDSWLQRACMPSCLSFDGGSSATVGFGGFDGINYRSGMAFFGAYFFFVGGSSGTALTTTSNIAVRGTY